MANILYSRSRKTHPGPIVHLSDNPLDASKVSSYYLIRIAMLKYKVVA